MAADVKVTFEQGFGAALLLLTASKLAAAAELVAAEQRRTIPVSKDGSYGRPPGHARDRIGLHPGVDGLGPYLDVGSDATTPDGFPYPVVLDAGSRPHVIEARNARSLTDGRGHFFGKRVHHPGTEPTYWCRASVGVLTGRTL